MKNNSHKSELKKILFTFLIAIILVSGSSFGQKNYDKAKVITESGHVLYGSKVRVSHESISFRSNMQNERYNFSELQQVMVKKGRARKWGMGLGSVCFAVMGWTLFDDPQANINHPNSLFFPYLGGTLALTALTIGFGYLLGTVADPWQEVYTRAHSVSNNQFKPVLNIDRKGRPMIGFSYSF